MASERNNTALEFETMLRRHLKSGGAPVAACAGFDFDAANAYLENALGGSQRTGYESHLAGCATCRRHLIELSRLAQTIPQVGTQPVTVADQTPAWVRWREVVAGWFDLSSWNLKWQLVGAAGAAFAILIAALGVLSWRQVSRQADGAIVASVATSAPSESEVQPPQSPTPDPSSQDATLPVASESVAMQQKQSQAPVPTPLVQPKDGLPEMAAVAPSGNSLNLASSQMNEAVPPNSRSRTGASDTSTQAQQSGEAAERRQGAQLAASTPVADKAGTASDLGLPHFGRPGRGPATDSSAQASRIPPSLGIDHNKPRPAPTPHSKPQTEKSSAPFKGLPRSVVWPFIKPDSKSEQERKERIDASDDESSKSLIIRIRDKVFRFENDVWIDQAYKPELQEWYVHKLTRDSEEYKQVLAKEPLLKEFFVKAPIVVVWYNKIYKVR